MLRPLLSFLSLLTSTIKTSASYVFAGTAKGLSSALATSKSPKRPNTLTYFLNVDFFFCFFRCCVSLIGKHNIDVLFFSFPNHPFLDSLNQFVPFDNNRKTSDSRLSIHSFCRVYLKQTLVVDCSIFRSIFLDTQVSNQVHQLPENLIKSWDKLGTSNNQPTTKFVLTDMCYADHINVQC